MSMVEESTLVKASEKPTSKAIKSKKDVGDNEEEERPVERKSSSDPTKKIAFVCPPPA
jgi:hypothetical protein